MYKVLLITPSFFTNNFIELSEWYIVNTGIMYQQEWRKGKVADFLTQSKPNKHLQAKRGVIFFLVMGVPKSRNIHRDKHGAAWKKSLFSWYPSLHIIASCS